MGDQKVIQNRLVFRFLNEAAACLDEEIVDDKDLLDAGVIFGTGFAPFRGGPMNHSLREGVEMIVATMADYESRFGERFHPAAGWKGLSE
jgi:3-hydroxyacyl-CoA dehydrogenase/enoyl-CoA hydratase/3-hydroxybutyryl-CoA epimerase